MKETLKKYIMDNYGNDKFQEIIDRNYLQYQYADETHNVKMLLNKANVILLQNELKEIAVKFDALGIKYIAFKGAILANRLYNNIYTRFFSDIDIFVFPKCFDKALNTLYEKGYVLRYPNVLLEPHHAALKKDKIVLELHRNILNPFTEIDETYLRSNLETLNVSGVDITTFDKTGTLLHMIYHLYMDTWPMYSNSYFIYATKSLPMAHRFFARAYEIALFSKKYFNEINWEEIVGDIMRQKLRIMLYIIIHNIIKIFPNIFPKKFTDAIYNIEYVSDRRDILYKYIIGYNLFDENIDVLLSNYIDYQWNNRASKNLQIALVGEFTLDDPIIKDQEISNDYQLSCMVQIEKKDDGISIVFRVSNDDFCFSENNDYDTLTSDGVHLIICGTRKYSYNSIFLFPKIVDGEIVVIPVNVLNGVNSEISDLSISTSYQKFESEYIITIVLKNEFLKANSIEQCFYLGLVISDCSSKTKKRKAELVLSNPYDEWYNPAYFAKINIKHGCYSQIDRSNV